ncbi:MAG: FG-GAP-like repeat-containing protein [Planctomycetaceae bacterium]
MSVALEVLEARVLLSGVSPEAIVVETDLAVELTSNSVAAEQGSNISYDITVTNNGPEGVTDAQVVDLVSHFLENVSWTATLNSGAVGNTSGTGDLDETVEIPAGASVEYVLTGTVKSDAYGTIANSVEVSSSSITDTVPENNVDGDSELVILASEGGSGYFVRNEDGLTPVTDESHLIEIADFNGDGWNDIILIEYFYSPEATADNQLWLNNGDGTFSLTGQSFGDLQVYDFHIGDLDQDGDLDLFLGVGETTGYSSTANVWLNDGTGSFSPSTQGLLDYAFEMSIMADLNGDSFLDIAIQTDNYGETNGSLHIWLNDGTGQFSIKPEAITLLAPYDLVAGDFDGDGDMDLAYTEDSYPTNESNSMNAYVGILFNDGDANFTGVYAAEAYNFPTLKVGDIDNDGDLDMISVSYMRNYAITLPYDDYYIAHNILINDGEGHFTRSNNYVRTAYTEDLELADIDNDGDLDFIFAGSYRETYPDSFDNNVWLNDGQGIFEPAEHQFYAESGELNYYMHNIAVGDLDNDGTLDAVVNSDTFGTDIWYNSVSGEIPYSQNFEGNIPGMEYLTPATTQIVNNMGNQVLQFDNSGLTGLSLALIDTLKPFPPAIQLSAEVQTASGPNRWLDGFVIFDYNSPTDFKYAGMFTGQNQWVIGHYQGNFSNRIAQVDWDDTSRTIKPNQSYLLQVLLMGLMWN